MIHADCVRCKGIEDEFPIETTAKWILGLGYPEVIIRTDGGSSLVALSRRVGEKTQRSRCPNNAQHKPSMRQQISRTRRERHQNCERASSHGGHVFARELHGVTIGKSHVSLPWCVRYAARVICTYHRGTDGMTGYRRAYGRSRMPRRYVPWSEKVFLPGAV